MDCKTANQLIHPYLQHELNLEQTDEFLKHIRECADCREELEIYFTVQAGISNLNQEEEAQTYDLKGLFEEELKETQACILRKRVWGGIRDLFLVAAIAALTLASLLKLKLWL